MNKTSLYNAEVAVIGAGPAGLVSAIALQEAGVDTLLIAPPPKPDHRTTALLAGSVTALETLGVWERCLPHAAPLRNLRITDDTRRLLRAPEMFFAATEIGRDAFGYNIENRYLIAALRSCAEEHRIPWVAAKRGCGSRLGRMGHAPHAEPPAALPRSGVPTRKPPSPRTFCIRARTAIRRASFTPNRVRSRWCLYRAGVQAWYACSIRRTPPCLRR
jgi:hypothetical protein